MYCVYSVPEMYTQSTSHEPGTVFRIRQVFTSGASGPKCAELKLLHPDIIQAQGTEVVRKY